tara:strand:+ start:524 stop:823 length:300 start_codon:yes stop_codon:yes gene_type:complete
MGFTEILHARNETPAAQINGPEWHRAYIIASLQGSPLRRRPESCSRQKTGTKFAKTLRRDAVGIARSSGPTNSVFPRELQRENFLNKKENMVGDERLEF